MATTITTQYMNLQLPIPGQTLGPEWALDLNAALTQIDAHTHQPGLGQPVPTNGININADLPFNSLNATLLRSSRYVNQNSPLALVADVTCVYASGGDLWYNNAIGQQVQITAGSSINVAGTGTIGGDYGQPGVPATVVYFVVPSNTYYFFQNTNQYAPLAVGPITISGTAANAKGVTLQSDPSLSANYSMTFPLALPVSTKILTVDSAGHIGDAYDVDGATITVTSNVIAVPPQGIQQVNLASRATGTTVPAGGVAVSTESGTFTTSSRSLVDVTNMTVTITTTGRPVMLMMQGAASDSLIQMESDVGGVAIMVTVILNTTNAMTVAAYETDGIVNGTSSLRINAGPLQALDMTVNGLPGTYTYKVQTEIVLPASGSAGINFKHMSLVAYEI